MLKPLGLYDDIIHTLNNILKNNQAKAAIFFDEKFRKEVIAVIDDMLALEIDHDVDYNGEKKWSTPFAQATVNISKEKIKFIKPDNKDLEDIYGDYLSVLNYADNILNIKKDTLTEKKVSISMDEIKLNGTLPESVKEQYKSEFTKEEPKVEVVDKTVEQPNSNAQQQNTQSQGFGGQQGAFGQNPFFQNLPNHPLQDKRFYPFTTKPKYMRFFKWGIGASMLAVVIMMIITAIYGLMNSLKLDAAFFGQIDEKVPEKGGNPVVLTFNLGSVLGVSADFFSIFMWILVFAFAVYASWQFLKPPSSFKELYWTRGWSFGMSILFVLMVYMQFGMGAPQILNHDSLTKVLTDNYVKGQEIPSADVDANSMSKLATHILDWNPVKVVQILLIITFAFNAILAISVITAWILNPRIDREKMNRANMEYQKAVAEAMVGRQYTIDPSLYESQEEMDKFNEKYGPKEKKKEDE